MSVDEKILNQGVSPALLELLQKNCGTSTGRLVELGTSLQSYVSNGQLQLDYRSFDPALSSGELRAALGQLQPDLIIYVSQLKQLPDPAGWLAEAASWDFVGGLVIDVPNLSHQDLAAKLLAGQPLEQSLLETGFTRGELEELVAAGNWQVVEQSNLVQPVSVYHDPEGLLHKANLAGDTVRLIARNFNSAAQVERFIWLLRPRPPRPETACPAPATQPAVSIMIRTQARRVELLTECLYSIYAQDCPPEYYEVVIALQTLTEEDNQPFDRFSQLLARLPESLTARLRYIRVYGEGRAGPLNPLLEAVEGRYMFFLDDDDLILPGCLTTLIKTVAEHGADAPVLHTYAIRRHIDVIDWRSLVYASGPGTASPGPEDLPYTDSLIFESILADPDITPRTYPYSVNKIELTWDKPYRPLYQQYQNEIPICNYILPRELVTQTNLRYNIDFIVYQDWEFLMRVLATFKVLSVPIFTSCINIRTNNTNAVNNTSLADTWKIYYEKCLQLREQNPLILEGRTLPEIIEHFQAYEKLRHEDAVLQNHAWHLETGQRILLEDKARLELALEHQKIHFQSELEDLQDKTQAILTVQQHDLDSYRHQAEDARNYAHSLEKQLTAARQPLRRKVISRLAHLVSNGRK